MIQDHLGDGAFWRSVQHYTRENMLKNVETSDFKKSIEEVSGQNLDWFFRQWVYDPGFPEYNFFQADLETVFLKKTFWTSNGKNPKFPPWNFVPEESADPVGNLQDF